MPDQSHGGRECWCCGASIDHLRSDARYCNATCKRQAARSRGFWGGYVQIRRPRTDRAALLAAAIAALVLLLAGCGGGSPRVSVKPITVAAGHVCTPQNTAMQCVLTGQKRSLLRALSPAVAYGWDFAWSCPSPVGRAFGWSYLSPDGSKNWTRSCLALYHSHGAATVAGWESSATRTAQGYSAGAADARAASAQLAALGAPAGQPFTMAIDFDASGHEVASYFQGANAAEPGRINAYGGYRPLLYLFQHGLVGHLNFQTYAWSGGAWLPASIAPLEQYLNSSAVDYDRAIASYYGQWPPPRPPGPSPDQIRHAIAARGASLSAYYKHRPRCTQPVLTTSACGQFAWRVDHFQKFIDTAHGYSPHCFGHDRNLGAAECQIVRPAVAVWTRALVSSKKAFSRRNHCLPPVGGPVTGRLCSLLWNRELHFQGRINDTLSTSRY